MKIILRALVALVLLLLPSVLLADFTLNLGAISSGQTLTIAMSAPSDSNCTLEVVNSSNQVVLTGSIQVVWTGLAPEYYDYFPSATPSISGLMVSYGGYRGTDIDITGLPSDTYQLRCYAPWGNSSTSVQLSGPFYWGSTTNFGAVDEYNSNLLFFDLFIY